MTQGHSPESLKRVLYLDHTAKLGGGEIALLNLLRALDKDRFEPVVVLASDGPLAARLRAAGIETQVLLLDAAVVETRKDGLGLFSLLRIRQVSALLLYARRLAALMRTRRINLVHTNSLKADIYGGLAARLARVPVVWHVRDRIDGEYLPPIVAVLFRWLARRVPSMVVTNSESTLRSLQVSPRKLTSVVYSGVTGTLVGGDRMRIVHDGTSVTGVETSVLPTDDGPDRFPTVVLVGRLAPWKGQHIFIEAAAAVLTHHPDVRFRIVGAPLFGEFDYERSLHALVENFGIGHRVEFLGFRDDVPALLACADIVVHASVLGEPFGQVVIEGMAAGKPVIATDGGALPEIVLSGETGLLVPMGDAPAMAGAIMTLLSDPLSARRMGAAGLARVQSHFTVEHTARKVEAIYDALFGLTPLK